MNTRSMILKGLDDVTLDLELVETTEGKKIYRMKGATHAERGAMPGLPAQFFAPMAFTPDQRAEGDGEEGEGEESDPFKVKGTASSTSQDSYGTEMSLEALGGMAEQFTAGVAFAPRHSDLWEPLEWDDIIGITTSGIVEKAVVVNAVDESEQGYIARIEADLYPNELAAQKLSQRLDDGQPIGLSIGGWFIEMRVICDEETGDVERIIIDNVRLDHLAVVRRPANPDSNDLSLMRGLIDGAVKALSIEEVPETPAEPEPVPVQYSQEDMDAKVAAAVEEATAPLAAAAAQLAEAKANAPDSPDPDNEDDMDAKELRALFEESLAPINERLEKIEAGAKEPTPTPDPEATREELKAKVKDLEARNALQGKRINDLADITDGGARRGFTPDNAFEAGSHEKGSTYDNLVQRADSDGGFPSLVEVCTRRAAVFAADRFDGKISRDDCEKSLRSILIAGQVDGLIRDPFAGTATWN